ncbi:MAG: MFS transporter [Anaerolineae bacterium]|nr:MFS transporter [Anaerolineae bacterium]
MTAFWFVWTGQLVSLLGSSMTQFGITIWIYQKTDSATALAVMGALFTIPLLLMSPVVGIMVDRYNLKLMMLLSDLAAGITTIVIFYLYVTGGLELWHLYVTTVINGIFQGFQWPAYSAALSVMIPKEHYVRANSMLEIAGPGSNLVAPSLAGALLGLGQAGGFDGLRLILLIDIVTFSAAVGSLLLIYVPKPEHSESGDEAAGGNIFKEAIYGFKYIVQRPSLLGLQISFMLGNLLANMGMLSLLAPLLLARTDNNAWLFGIMQTTGAAGIVAGGLIVGAWGGFKQRIHGVLLGWAVSFLFQAVIVGLGRTEPAWMIGLWAAGIFCGSLPVALINGSNQSIWMAKVAPDVQGRVFSARRLIAWFAAPLGALIAGPLADFVMEPAMQSGGALAGTFGWLVGIGPGAGMSLLFIITGIIGILTSLGMYLVPVIRDAEDLLPDYQANPVETGA